jgi:hypothetical protein
VQRAAVEPSAVDPAGLPLDCHGGAVEDLGHHDGRVAAADRWLHDRRWQRLTGGAGDRVGYPADIGSGREARCGLVRDAPAALRDGAGELKARDSLVRLAGAEHMAVRDQGDVGTWDRTVDPYVLSAGVQVRGDVDWARGVLLVGAGATGIHWLPDGTSLCSSPSHCSANRVSLRDRRIPGSSGKRWSPDVASPLATVR